MPVAAAVAWASGQPGDGRRRLGARRRLRRIPAAQPVITLLLSLGPVLLPALAGLESAPAANGTRPVTGRATGIGLGLFLLYFVRISEASWVGFRAGQILLVCDPDPARADVLAVGCHAHAALLAAVISCSACRRPSIDTWNAQDISNRRQGPGFRWTLWTTPDQQQAFAGFVRTHRRDAIVQMEPMVRGREHWTLIPSFAGRRMAAGLPISLLPLPEYPEASERVQTIFATRQRRAKRPTRPAPADRLPVRGCDRHRMRIPRACESSTSTRSCSRACFPAVMFASTG